MMLPGGATCNLYALQLARYTYDSTLNTTGMYNQKPLVIFTSDQSHYSITKSAMLMGLGKNHVVKVATNELGQMDISDLEQQIEKTIQAGQQPLMINATSGTTVLGAYDDLVSIALIAKKYKIRLHVDAIWGGGVILHDMLKTKMKGIQHADSR